MRRLASVLLFLMVSPALLASDKIMLGSIPVSLGQPLSTLATLCPITVQAPIRETFSEDGCWLNPAEEEPSRFVLGTGKGGGIKLLANLTFNGGKLTLIQREWPTLTPNEETLRFIRDLISLVEDRSGERAPAQVVIVSRHSPTFTAKALIITVGGSAVRLTILDTPGEKPVVGLTEMYEAPRRPDPRRH